MKGTIDRLVLYRICRKSTKDAFWLKCLGFLTKYFLNISVDFGRDLTHHSGF